MAVALAITKNFEFELTQIWSGELLISETSERGLSLTTNLLILADSLFFNLIDCLHDGVFGLDFFFLTNFRFCLFDFLDIILSLMKRSLIR